MSFINNGKYPNDKSYQPIAVMDHYLFIGFPAININMEAICSSLCRYRLTIGVLKNNNYQMILEIRMNTIPVD